MKIYSKFKKFINTSNLNNLELKNHSLKTDDIYSLSILQPLLINLPYLPFNGGALRPICISYILNEIIINQRKNILEFGSGLSTILIARLLKKNNLEAQIITIEHNNEWANIIHEYLVNENLLKYVTIIRTDLKEIETPLGNVNWYDYDIISNALNDKKIDLLIIDGPLANTEKIKYSRSPALFEMNKYLASDFCILLDDANRKGEKDLIRLFKKKNLKIKFQLISKTLAVFRSTEKFNPIPIHY